MAQDSMERRYDKALFVLAGCVIGLVILGIAAWIWAALATPASSEPALASARFAGFSRPVGGERALHWTVGKRAVGLEKIAEFDVPTGPEAMVTLPDGRLLVTCRLAKVVAVLDPARGRVTRQVPVEGRPLAICLTRDGTRSWVTLEDQSQVVVLDVETMRMVAHAETGRAPEAMAAHPESEVVAIANWGSRDLTVLDGGKAEVLGTVPLPSSPRGAVVHPQKPFVTVSITGSDRLAKVNWRKLQVEDELVVGRGPRHMVQAANGDTLYVALNSPPTIAKVDRPGGRVRATCYLSKGRAGTILLGPNERDLFVANARASAVTVIDTASMSESVTAEADLSPDGLALSADGRRLYVAHRNTAVVHEYAVTYERAMGDAASSE
jgi:DNA-binding beta-propeller fold protein YncE